MKRRDRYAAIRTDAVVAGARDVARVRPLVSTRQRTVIDPALAAAVGGIPGPVQCTRSSLGRYCGPTQRIAIALDGCRSARVAAIVAPTARSIGSMIVGVDVLQKARPVLSFARHRPIRVICSR